MSTQFSTSIAAAAIQCGASSISHHPAGVVVQFASGQACKQFVSQVVQAGIQHQVVFPDCRSRAVPGASSVFSVVFGAQPPGGI